MNTADLIAEAEELTGVEARRERLQIFCALVGARARSAAPGAVMEAGKELWNLAGWLREVTLDG